MAWPTYELFSNFFLPPSPSPVIPFLAASVPMDMVTQAGADKGQDK